MKKLLQDAADRAIAYRATIDQRSVAPAKDAVEQVEKFRESLPEEGNSEESTLAMLDELGSPAAIGMTSPRFFGFVIGGSMPVTLAANWIAGAWDQNTVMHDVAPAVSTLEQVSIEWMLEMLNLPRESGASFVTGATVANFTALSAARNTVLQRAGWNCRQDGLIGAPDLQVIVSEEAHPTLLKSLGLAGIGENRVTRVAVDEQGRMRVDTLPEITGPSIVCTQVGNINTGAFDPVGEICDAVAGNNVWVHVDGAFGLWAAACPNLQHMTAGMEKADSWATDGHKWLNVPYDCGLAFVRDEEALRAAMAISAAYLPVFSGQRQPSDYTPELSRRARGVEVWAALRTLGRNGLINMVEGCCARAKQFGEELSAAGFEILNDVVLNQVLVSFGTPEQTLEIIGRIQDDGTCWCGRTVWQGKTAMRISVSNWATSEDDVRASVAAITRIANEVLG